MFVWGSKGGVADLGAQGSKQCPVCERERSFRLMLQYKVSHFWYVFKWVSEKQYAVVCEICQRGEKLATQAVEARLGKPRIPTGGSRALMVVVATFVGLSALGLVSRAGDHAKTLVASPQKNDLYVVNLAPFQKSPQSLEMYGILRVRSVDGERVQFDTPTVAYDRLPRAQKDLKNGKLADPAYFTGEPLALPRADLVAMQQKGALKSVERP